MMRVKKCPRVDQLQALAESRAVPARVARHVATCEACTNMVAQLREDARFTALLRQATRLGLDDETHARVLEICDRAVAEAKRRIKPRE